MSLYQKPGKDSTEYLLTICINVASAGLAIAGVVLAVSVERMVGLAMLGTATFASSAATIGYAASRGKVKAAAESARPPPSRVV